MRRSCCLQPAAPPPLKHLESSRRWNRLKKITVAASGENMKKQLPLGQPYSFSAPSRHAHGGSSNGSGVGGSNLPNIFQHPVLLPRPQSGLRLDIHGLHNPGGLFLSNGAARERPERGLASSDPTSERIRHAQKYHAHYASRTHTSDGRLLHNQRGSQPIESREKAFTGLGGIGGGVPSSIVRRQPSATLDARLPHMRPGTLPPIGAESETCDSHTTPEEESVFGDMKDGEEDNVESDDGSETDTDDEFLETESEAPPSRPGFESDAEKSAEVFKIPFPDVKTSAPFPATLIQNHAQLDSEKCSAGTTSTGLSPRVNNIVRAFNIHGPLDKELLAHALNKVVNFHPLLSAVFQLFKGQLYAQLPQLESEERAVELDTPVVGHEQPEDLILNARRKIFTIDTSNDILSSSIASSQDQENFIDGLPNAMSLTSIADNDFHNSADNSPTIEVAQNHQSPRKRMVSFAEIQTAEEPAKSDAAKCEAARSETAKSETAKVSDSIVPPHHLRHSQLPALEPSTGQEKPGSPLIRARLVSKTNLKHILVLSFPRIVCDFWSSCLFMQQVADTYSKLEKAATYKPSLAVKRLESKREEIRNAFEKEKKRNAPTRKLDAATRLLQKKAAMAKKAEEIKCHHIVPMVVPKLKFPQIAQREKQLVMMMSRDQLQAFWEGIATATIRRERGLSRTKIVPPVRIPSGLGEMPPVSSYSKRPQTSRLRPLTASRARPTTAKRQGGGVFGEVGFTRETLMGPATKFHFIKIDDEVCEKFKLLLPESCPIPSDQKFRLFTLGAYILMLGKCCRGWGLERHVTRDLRTATVRRGERTLGMSGISGREEEWSLLNSTVLGGAETAGDVKPVLPDPLQQYSKLGRAHRQALLTQQQQQQQPIAMGEGHSPQLRGGRKGARLDVGSFLIGVETSLRDCEPEMTEGVFGPLTNEVAIRINLSSSETFPDLIAALSKSLQLANKHGHLPFAPVAEEVGLMSGIPIKFSYFQHRDVIQVANPNSYFYTETAVGVVNQGLSRLGSSCYLTPLNSKMDDSCHFELTLWESYDLNDSLAGGFRYQPQVIKTELVEAFGEEFCRLLVLLANHPEAKLLDLVKEIHPPFLSARSKTRVGRKGMSRSRM